MVRIRPAAVAMGGEDGDGAVAAGSVIGAGGGALLRVAVLIAGILFGTSIQADLSTPGTAFIVLATIPLAWFEELGWRPSRPYVLTELTEPTDLPEPTGASRD